VLIRAPAARFRVFWYLPPSSPRPSQWNTPTTSYMAFPTYTGSTTSNCSAFWFTDGFDSSRDGKKLVDVKETEKQTTLCLAAAHALVRLDDGTIVGDPMEKTTLEALDWKLSKGLLVLYQLRMMLIQLVHAGETITPSSAAAPHRTQLTIRRRFQFSSALKRMSTISSLPGGRTLATIKGAPETIKGMLKECPEWYDETYKWYTRRGSWVLALGAKDMDTMSMDKVRRCVPNLLIMESDLW